MGLHTKWRYEQHAVDAINIALARCRHKKKKTTFRLSSLVRCVGDLNVALWLSLQRVITEGVPQSQNAERRYTTEVMLSKMQQRTITDEEAQSR